VGGVPAQVVEATGTEATFIVPEGAPEGPVRVRAVNPGRHSGSARWVVARPGGCALLDGSESAPALSAIRDLDSGNHLRPEEISTDEHGVRIARTTFEIWFTDGTTVGEVNDLLDRFGARIVTMLAGVPAVIVRIPDPGSLVALDALIAVLKLDPRVSAVRKGELSELAQMPGGVGDPPTAAGGEVNRHQIAIRAPAAWNARAARKATPRVGMSDSFGLGPPGPVFDVEILSGDFALSSAGAPYTPKEIRHGYAVLSVIAAAFDDTAELAGVAAGPVQLFALNINGLIDQNREEDLILAAARSLGGGLVWNRSLALRSCETDLEPVDCDNRATDWIQRVTAAGLEDAFLLVSAAGNVDDDYAQTHRDAARASPINAAALRPLGVPNLTNTLVVENRGNYRLGDAFYVPNDDLYETSFSGGHVSAIGSEIYTHANNDAGVASVVGTSYSAPHVAGLAAYLWSIEPELGPQGIIEILQRTATSQPGGAPLIDAYAAVLALDEGVDAPEQAPVRMAILDVVPAPPGGARRFDEADVASYLSEFSASRSGFDHSRWDLNGDGATGDSTSFWWSRRIDLDASGGIDAEMLQDIQGTFVGYDEGSASDLETLCYYAYSGLYQGDEVERAHQLALKCGATPTIEFGNVPAGLEPGVPHRLDVRVEVPAEDGSRIALRDVDLLMTVSGGQVQPSPPTVNTGPEGVLALEVTLLAPAEEIEIGMVVPDSLGRVSRTVVIPLGESGPGCETLQATESLGGEVKILSSSCSTTDRLVVTDSQNGFQICADQEQQMCQPMKSYSAASATALECLGPGGRASGTVSGIHTAGLAVDAVTGSITFSTAYSRSVNLEPDSAQLTELFTQRRCRVEFEITRNYTYTQSAGLSLTVVQCATSGCRGSLVLTPGVFAIDFTRTTGAVGACTPTGPCLPTSNNVQDSAYFSMSPASP
jgi:subtilisin family serine protease